MVQCRQIDEIRITVTTMNERLYHDRLDELMIAIEDAIEDSELDIDYETSAGILTLRCPDNSQVILSRQTALLQLWVAAKSGGFHFNYDESEQAWILEGSDDVLSVVLNRCLSEQCGCEVSLAI